MAVILILVHPMSTLSRAHLLLPSQFISPSLSIHDSVDATRSEDRGDDENMFLFPSSLSLSFSRARLSSHAIFVSFSPPLDRGPRSLRSKSLSLSLSKTNERTKRPTEYGRTNGPIERKTEKRERAGLIP